MKTRVVRVDPDLPDPEVLAQAGALIRAGELVSFPTETVYGLGADATNAQAVHRIFAVKGRPQDNPIIVHVAAPEEVAKLVTEVPAEARLLMAAFWPGPLTLVLPRRPIVPDAVTAGLDTVAIRLPAHSVARALIRAAGRPIAAPSANTSGRPSPTRAEDVLADLDGKIPLIIDGGDCRVGVESTVLALVPGPVVLRPGGISTEEIARVLGRPVRVDRGVLANIAGSQGALVDVTAGDVVPAGVTQAGTPPRSPGMKYRHYAPRAELVVYWGAGVAEALRAEQEERAARGQRVGLLISMETARALGVSVHDGPDERGAPREAVVIWGRRGDAASLGRLLFTALRILDRAGVDVILAEGVEPEGIGLAVMDRMARAAGGRVRRV